MGMKRIDLRWTVSLNGDHEVRLVREPGFFTDSLQVLVDGTQVADVPAGGFAAGGGTHRFSVGGHPVELRWVWSALTGDPKAIVLLDSDQKAVLASTGESEVVDRIVQQAPSGGRSALLAQVGCGCAIAAVLVAATFAVVGVGLLGSGPGSGAAIGLVGGPVELLNETVVVADNGWTRKSFVVSRRSDVQVSAVALAGGFDLVVAPAADASGAIGDPAKRIYGLSADDMSRFIQSAVLEPGSYILALSESSDPNLIFAADTATVELKITAFPP